MRKSSDKRGIVTGMLAALFIGITMPSEGKASASHVSMHAALSNALMVTQSRTQHPMPSVEMPRTQSGPSGKAATKITLTVKEQTIESAITAVLRQAKLQPLYDRNNPVFTKRISVRLTNVTVFGALEQILQGTGLVARLTSDGETIMIRSQDETTPGGQQQGSGGTIQVHIKDSASGRAMSGVTVTVVGTRISAVTNEQGQLVLRGVPVGEQSVVAKLFGYRAATRSVTVQENQSVSISLTLASVPEALTEVVTTATGQQERKTIGNDIAKINVPELLKNAPVTTMSELLTNRIPGLIVQKTSGAVGSPSVIRIRGTSSINLNNDPVIIVDGVRVYSTVTAAHDASVVPGDIAPSALDGIDPNSVESVEVLRGPSAAALYGTDAANGIIVITTKRGQAGPTRWRVSTQQSASFIPGKYPLFYRLWGRDDVGNVFRCFRAEPWGGVPGIVGAGRCTSFDSLQTFQLLNDGRTTLLGRGSMQGYSLAMEGGAAAVQYSLTLTNQDELGYVQMPTADAERLEQTTGNRVPKWQRRPNSASNVAGTSRMTVRVNEDIDVALTASLNRRVTRSTPLTGAIGQYFREPDPLDSLITLSRVKDFRTRGEARRSVTRFAVNGQWRLHPRLLTALDLGWDQTDRHDRSLLRRGDCPGCIEVAAGTSLQPSRQGTYRGMQSTDDVISLASRATFQLMDWNMLSATTTMGLSYTEATGNQIDVSANDLAAGANSFVGARWVGTAGSSRDSRVAGIFIDQRIALFNKYYTGFGVRFDRGSGLGRRASLPTFPKLDFSIPILTDERPWRHINTLRLRTAYGHSGIQPDITARLRTYSRRVVDISGGLGGNLGIVTIGNTILKPERGVEFEGGIDLGAWNNRVEIGLTGYRKKTRDLLITIGLPPSVAGGVANDGGYSQQKNLGDVLNTGIETTLGLHAIETQTVSWMVRGVIAVNREKLLSIARDMVPNLANPSVLVSSAQRPITATQFNVVGYPLNGYWGRPLVAFADVNGDGFLALDEIRLSDTAVYLGSRYPRYTAGISSQLGVLGGRINITSSFEIQNGATQMNRTASGGYGAGQSISFFLRPMNDTLVSLEDRAKTLSGTAFINRVSTVRWSELSIRAVVPSEWTRFLKTTMTSVALQGSNLRLWSNYSGKDPNVRDRFDTSTPGDYGQVPPERRMLLRVDLQW